MQDNLLPTTGNFDGTEANDVDAQLFVRTRMILLVLLTLLFSLLLVVHLKQEVFNLEQFLQALTQIRILECLVRYTAKIQARQEIKTNITQNAGATAYTFDNAFFTGTSEQTVIYHQYNCTKLSFWDYFEITNFLERDLQ